MTRTIAWTDGTTWTADEPTFRRITDRLDAARSSIAGLDPIFAAWTDCAARGERLDVDAFAPSEDDRAILTAALARAQEDARAAGAEALGFDDVADFHTFLGKLGGLHELFVTDVTHELPDVKKQKKK